MPRRHTRLTKADIDNIFDAMEFCLAGEFPFDSDPELTEAQNKAKLVSFERTRDKIADRA